MLLGRIRRNSLVATRAIAAALLATSIVAAAVPAAALTTTTMTSPHDGPVVTPTCTIASADPNANAFWNDLANAWFFAFGRTVQCGNPPTISETRRIDLFARVNAERVGRGLAPLRWDPTLASYADGWSAYMAAHGFGHSNIASLMGPYDFAGENIAMGSRGVSVGMLHSALMHSDFHRSNILAPGFTTVGIGAFCASDGSLWLTEDFGRPTSEGPPPQANGIPPVNPVMRGDSGSDEC